jgi:uncharacterized membrane protein
MSPAIVALIYVTVLCTAGIFHRAYRDNTLQQWGLVCIAVSCVGLMWHVSKFEVIGLPCLLMLAGLVAFATGTAAKVIHYTRKRNGQLISKVTADATR